MMGEMKKKEDANVFFWRQAKISKTTTASIIPSAVGASQDSLQSRTKFQNNMIYQHLIIYFPTFSHLYQSVSFRPSVVSV